MPHTGFLYNLRATLGVVVFFYLLLRCAHFVHVSVPVWAAWAILAGSLPFGIWVGFRKESPATTTALVTEVTSG